jgi:hypothetical protein
MTKAKLITAGILVVGMLLATMPSTWGAYLEQDHEKARPREPERVIPPPPPPRNEIGELISRVRVSGPFTFKNVTVFPLRLSAPSVYSDYKTLDESLSRGYIEILEEKSPDVRSVLVRNNSPYTIFLMAGESLAGGKQNRLISEDVLLAPHGRPVRIPVYCIERGRWSPAERELASGGFAAPSSMRRMAREKVSQTALWDAVSGLLEETGSRSENEDLRAAFENDSVREELGRFRREFRIPFRETVGCVVVVHGRIAGSDLFSSPELSRKLWHKVLDSYVMDAIPLSKRHGLWPGPPSVEEVRRFLDTVFRASFRERGGRDLGRIVEIAGSGIEGEGLVHRGDAVHVHLTPRRETRF